MATTDSAATQQVKARNRRRLIGSIAIVAGLVVFLPMLLDKGPKPIKKDIAINIPAQEGAGYTPLKPAAKPADSKPVEIKTVEQKPATETKLPSDSKTIPEAPPLDIKRGAPLNSANDVVPAAPKNTVLKPIPKPTAEPVETKPAAAPTDNAKSASGKFAVQIGVFSDANNVKEIQAKLAVIGFKSNAEIVETDKGTKTRVRVNGFVSRENADKALTKIHAVEKNAMVVPQ